MIVKRTQAGLMLAAGLFLTLNGCKSEVLTRDVPVRVSVPVAVPCVTNWPQKPPPLPDGSHWAALDTRQKAATIGAHAIALRNYADNLAAVTGGCR